MLALLVVGSATLLFSCANAGDTTEYDYETLMTERSEHRTIVMTENGERSYSFSAPLIEGYSLARNPYQEFRKGIHMITYTSDSLSLEDATITANYAIYYDKQKLKEHLAEEAAQEKAESKARRDAFMKKLMNPGKRK